MGKKAGRWVCPLTWTGHFDSSYGNKRQDFKWWFVVLKYLDYFLNGTLLRSQSILTRVRLEKSLLYVWPLSCLQVLIRYCWTTDALQLPELTLLSRSWPYAFTFVWDALHTWQSGQLIRLNLWCMHAFPEPANALGSIKTHLSMVCQVLKVVVLFLLLLPFSFLMMIRSSSAWIH